MMNAARDWGGCSRPVTVAVIGAGKFGAGVVAAAARAPGVRVLAVADRDERAAAGAVEGAGLAAEQVLVTGDSTRVFGLPVEVIVEATGEPEGGAVHALRAIERRIHVAMVTKETDVTVGPILKRLADRAGVVYTAVDGDQHGLLMGLVAWARSLGLEIVCGGKALDKEAVFDPSAGTLTLGKRTWKLGEAERRWFAPAPVGAEGEFVAARREILGDAGRPGNWDLVEMAIAANGTGLRPACPDLLCPAVYATEIPRVLGTGRAGAIDSVMLVRQAHEAGMGGGVFAVVAGGSPAVQAVLTSKNLVRGSSGGGALVTWPQHLLGVEALGSIIAAARGGVATGAREYRPAYDVVVSATTGLRAGQKLGGDHDPALRARIMPATSLSRNDPLPAHLANGNVLCADVPVGGTILRDGVVRPVRSVLWELRERQEREVGGAPAST